MNFFKRAVISIRNRKGRSILFLLLFTIVFSLILSGFAIQQSAAQEKINARKSLGAEVRLKRDSNKMKQKILKGNVSFNTISKETVEKIGQLPQVKSTYLSGSARAEESNLTYVKPKSSTTPSSDLPSTGASPKFEVEGTTNLSETTDFKNHDSKLIEGKAITKTSGENSAVVEETFSKNNKLKVGDTFNLKGTSIDNKGRELSLKVIGIYKSEKAPSALDAQYAFTLPENKIYLNFDTFTKLSDQARIEDVSYNLKDPLLVDEFVTEANTILEKDDILYKFDAHTKEYEQMVGPLEKMSSFSSIMIKVIIFAGAVILLLLILLSVKERKSEIGILLALGEGKRNIILQLLMEIMLLAVASFMLSTALIQSSGQGISNSILSSQISKDKDNINDDMNNDFEFDDEQETNNTTNVQPVDQISISLNSTIIAKTAIIGLILVVIATLIPDAIISRLDPKYLFSQKE